MQALTQTDNPRAKLARVLAWIFFLLTGLGLITWLVLFIDACGANPYADAEDDLLITLVSNFVPTLTAAAFAVLGLLINYFRPENRIGWISSLIGFAFMTMQLSGSYVGCWEAGVLALPGSRYLAWLAYVAPFPAVLFMFAMLPFWFPDGRFVSARWGKIGVAALLLTAAFQLAVALLPGPMDINDMGLKLALDNPFGWQAIPRTMGLFFAQGLTLTVLAACFLAIASLVWRWRQSSGDTRQQLKWFAYFLATAVTGQLIIEFYGAFFNPQIFQQWIYPLVIIAVFGGFPLTIGIAVLKYRLYDIDLIIRRTLVYGLVMGLLAAVYLAGLLLLQSIFRSLSGAESPLAIVVSTLAIAALFNPLRRRVQAFVDRRFYRQKYDAAQTLAQFAQTARDEVELPALTAEMVRIIRETVQPSSVSLWFRRSGHSGD